MSIMQLKINKDAKMQVKKMTHHKNKNQVIETDTEMTQNQQTRTLKQLR